MSILPSPKPPTAPPPVPGRLQDFIYQLDIGVGVKILKVLLFLLLTLFLMLLYTSTQYTGLMEPEAMDMAQVGRNLARGKGFTTNVIRPYSLWYLQFERHREAQVDSLPE